MRDAAIRFAAIALSALAMILIAGCGGGGGNAVTVQTVTETGLNGEDVYFIFTNPDPDSRALGVPDVHYSAAGANDRSSRTDEESAAAASGPPPRGLFDPQLWKLPDDIRPNIELGPRNAGASSSAAYTFPVETPDVTSKDFYVAYGSTDMIRATCRAKETIDGKTLSLYVADDSWHAGGTGTYLMDEEMVEAAFDAFLSSGDDNDIWDWMVDVFGEPWGIQYWESNPIQFSNMLEEGAEDHITILFTDIEEDDSPNSGIGGYFSSQNNFVDTSTADYASNERLMFVMDSVMFANPTETWDSDSQVWEDRDGWHTTDNNPRFIISTLAHEFQHMIHFYQKQITHEIASNGYLIPSDTWMNEMCSMAAEDLLSAKMGVPGPRGIETPTLMSAGSVSDATSGRLFEYNGRHDRSLTTWSYDDTVGFDYAASYSFGAFLARNYGGAALFRDIVRNTHIDQQAVTEAISDLGFGNVSFGDLLVEWGEAVILSDDDDPYISYDGASMDGYNSGGAFSSSPDDPDGTDYDLGSIDFFNYQAYSDGWTGQLGPLFYENGGDSPRRPGPASNVIFLAAENVDELEMEVEVPVGSILTVVTK